MGCPKCWPTLSQAEIDRRGLSCRQQCEEEGGCPRCAAKKAMKEQPLHQLREKVLTIFGKAAAFNLMSDFDEGEAKETGLQIRKESEEALKLINQMRRAERLTSLTE
jgi:hypothetical protein